jgi:putative transposase
LAFYKFLAEHWIHLHTTNPIESAFATVRPRTKITKGPARGPPGSRWRSSSSSPAQTRWLAVIAKLLVALVRAGATFTELVERPGEGNDRAIA